MKCNNCISEHTCKYRAGVEQKTQLTLSQYVPLLKIPFEPIAKIKKTMTGAILNQCRIFKAKESKKKHCDIATGIEGFG